MFLQVGGEQFSARGQAPRAVTFYPGYPY